MRAPHSRALLLPLALLLANFAPATGAQDRAVDAAATAGASASESTSPLERARRLTSGWEEARYAIHTPRKNLGVYHQKNVLHELPDGRAVLEFKDSILLFRNDDPVEYRTECAVSADFELLSISGRFGQMGSASVQCRDGKAVGNSSRSGKFGMETPLLMSSPMTLLRGLRHQNLKQNEPTEWDNFVIEGAPKKSALQKIMLTYLGEEEVVAQGVAYAGKKYELKAGKNKKVMSWFGSDGQLLKVLEGSQSWALMPPGAEKPMQITRKKKAPPKDSD